MASRKGNLEIFLLYWDLKKLTNRSFGLFVVRMQISFLNMSLQNMGLCVRMSTWPILLGRPFPILLGLDGQFQLIQILVATMNW